jgi:hypothetical protein
VSTYAVGGGKIDQEGFLKFLLHMFAQGYSRGMNVTQRGAGANMSVDVNVDSSNFAGALFMTSAAVPYYGYQDATTNVTVSTADPSNQRIDTVVAYIDLSLITSSTTNNNGALKFKAVAGTPAGSPSAPSGATIQSSVGAGNPYVALANLSVAAGASSVVNANITDGRSPMAFLVPYLKGGSSNTKGHLVPNQADGQIVTTTDVGSIIAAMLATNSVTAAKLDTAAIKLGFASLGSPVTLTTPSSATLITGLSTTVTIPAGGRSVKLTGWTTNLGSSTGSGTVTLGLWDGSVGSGTLVAATIVVLATTQQPGGPVMAVVTPSAGSKTYNLAITCTSGNFTAGAGSFILVEAI